MSSATGTRAAALVALIAATAVGIYGYSLGANWLVWIPSAGTAAVLIWPRRLIVGVALALAIGLTLIAAASIGWLYLPAVVALIVALDVTERLPRETPSFTDLS